MPSRDVVLSQPVRTAIGTFNGTLKGTPATELGATVVRETLRRSGLEPARVGSVVMGNVIQAGNRMNPARQAAINGGVPVAVPAMTVNRVCGSGAQAIVSAAQEILAGDIDAATLNADVALVLADAWQGQGLGRRLLATLLEHAQAAGVREAVGVVLATNKAMLRLARSMGFALTAEPGDATVMRIRRDLRTLSTQPH